MSETSDPTAVYRLLRDRLDPDRLRARITKPTRSVRWFVVSRQRTPASLLHLPVQTKDLVTLIEEETGIPQTAFQVSVLHADVIATLPAGALRSLPDFAASAIFQDGRWEPNAMYLAMAAAGEGNAETLCRVLNAWPHQFDDFDFLSLDEYSGDWTDNEWRRVAPKVLCIVGNCAICHGPSQGYFARPRAELISEIP